MENEKGPAFRSCLHPLACTLAILLTNWNNTMKPTAVRTLLLLGLILLAACSSASPTVAPQSTQDTTTLRTEVAATVLAQIPTFIAMTPTITQPPTATEATTPTVTLTPSLTITATTVTPVGPTATLASADHAKFVAQTVADGTVFAPGQVFTQTWTLQNTGTTTWTAAYRLRFFSGDRFGAPAEIALGKDVAAGQSVDIGIQMKAPATAGEYRSDWVMSNTALRNFNEPVYLKIRVSVPSTATVTKPAPTATDTPKP